MANALDRLDRDRVARAAGDAHVAGDSGDVERAVVADLERLRRAIDLFGPLPRLGVAIEPAGARPIVGEHAAIGDRALGDRRDGEERQNKVHV